MNGPALRMPKMNGPANLTRTFVPLPCWRPDRRFWTTVGLCVAWGPFIGGLPMNIFVLPIPFAYIFGSGPAALGGMFYALWWHSPSRHRPGAIHRILIGAICGCSGLWICMGLLGANPYNHPRGFADPMTLFALLGGAGTAAIIGRTRAPRSSGPEAFKRRI